MFSIFKRVNQLEAEVVVLHTHIKSLQLEVQQKNLPSLDKFTEKVSLLDNLLKKAYAREYYYKVTKRKKRNG
jgi:hypothetical protein